MKSTQSKSLMHRLTVVKRWAGDSQRWLAAFLKTAPSNRAIVSTIVMGSAVRERGHRRSDFDLLLIYQGTRPLVEAPIEVDIRLVSMERANAQIADGHEIVCWALKFGEALYDPIGYWGDLQKSWNNRIPLPSATEASRRGKQALVRAKEMLQLGDESAADDLVLAAITQFVRERLIKHEIFPASRPELPDQLRSIKKNDPLANLLEEAMYEDHSPQDLLVQLTEIDSGRR